MKTLGRILFYTSCGAAVLTGAYHYPAFASVAVLLWLIGQWLDFEFARFRSDRERREAVAERRHREIMHALDRLQSRLGPQWRLPHIVGEDDQ